MSDEVRFGYYIGSRHGPLRFVPNEVLFPAGPCNDREIIGTPLTDDEEVEAGILASLAARLAPESSTPINKTPGVCGGNACVRDTRIPVWALWEMRASGLQDSEILGAYPQLTRRDLGAAWGYVLANLDEIKGCIRENRRAVREGG